MRAFLFTKILQFYYVNQKQQTLRILNPVPSSQVRIIQTPAVMSTQVRMLCPTALLLSPLTVRSVHYQYDMICQRPKRDLMYKPEQ